MVENDRRNVGRPVKRWVEDIVRIADVMDASTGPLHKLREAVGGVVDESKSRLLKYSSMCLFNIKNRIHL